MNYESIKELAKEANCRVTELLALARQNDPFYVGTPTDLAQAEWFLNKIWQPGGFRQGAHLRRLHYWAVSQGNLGDHNGEPYENTDRCWRYLCQAAKVARYLGYVRIQDIADHKNPDPHIYVSYSRHNTSVDFTVSPLEIEAPGIYISGFDNYAMFQPYHLEVWFEKSTMNDVLLPVCRKYRANLVTGEGEMSITATYALVKRIKEANKPTRIFYGSDFDPAGHSIPRAVARKIEWMLTTAELDADVKLTPLVLTKEQVEKYSLPRIPIKESERRAAAFEDVYGEGAVELDALEALYPGELAKIVGEALSAYYCEEAEAAAEERENELRQAIQEKVEEIIEPYRDAIQEAIQALDGINTELQQLTLPSLGDYQPMSAAPTADDSRYPWLYCAGRTYLEQLQAYKHYDDGLLTTDNGRHP